MAILWMGGEDVDFPNGLSVNTTTNSGWFRSGYGRCAVSGNNNVTPSKSTVFPGGAVTSCWLSFRGFSGQGNSTANILLGQSGTNSGIGLLFNGNNSYSISLVTWNGTSAVTLVSTAGGIVGLALHKYDLQLISYGSSGTLNLYIDGSQVLTHTGNLSITGVTGFDSVYLLASAGLYCSEIVVADESTLAFQGLVTMAPNANGTTQQWSNPAYTNINPTTINDANATYVNATGDDEQVGLIAIPSGSFTVKAVKTIARAMATSGAASTNLEVGFKNGSGTVAVGSSHALGTAFAPVEDYFTTDPTTGAAWGSLASYQLDLRSA